MNRQLEKIPGVLWHFTQPIADEMEEAETGIKGELAVKIYGDDLKILEEKGMQVVRVMRTIPGIDDLGMLRVTGQPNLNLTVDRDAAARFQINVADVQDAIQTAVGGKAVSQVLQGEQRYDLVARYLPSYRDTGDAIDNIRLLSPSGEHVSLAQLCKIRLADGASTLYREANSRYVAISYSVRGRDLGSTVEEAMRKVNSAGEAADRVTRTNGPGEYESQKRSEARLMIIVPLTIFLIFLIIYGAFGSAKWACLHLVNVAVARVGGLLALYITGTHFSVSSGVGFLALFGASVQTGVIMVDYINQLRARGYSIEERRDRRSGAEAQADHDDHVGSHPGPVAGRTLSCHRIGFAASVCHRDRRRTHRRPDHEHVPAAHLLRLVGTAYRSIAVARVVAATPGAPFPEEALVATGRADEFMIELMACPSCCRADSIAPASRVQWVQSGPTERAICIATSSLPEVFQNLDIFIVLDTVSQPL